MKIPFTINKLFFRYSLLLLFVFVQMAFVMHEDKPAYIIYNSKGKKVSYDKMMKALKKSDMVFLANCIITQ